MLAGGAVVRGLLLLLAADPDPDPAAAAAVRDGGGKYGGYSRGDRARARDERSVRPVGPFGRRRRRIRS